MRRRLQVILPVVFIVVPVIIELFYIYLFAVNVPYWDEWDVVLLLQPLPRTSWLSVFWTQHNEHRILFPNLIFFILAKVSKWNVIVEMYFSVFISCVALLGLWFIYRKTCHGSLWRFVLVSWLFFSLGQFENILWGWQVEIYLQVLGVIWAVYFLSGKSFLSLTWAGLCGLLASFSFNSGLLIWPVGLAYLIGSKVEKKLLAYWSAIGLFTAATYLVDYHPLLNVPSPLQVLFQPITAIPFFLANYGASLGGGYFKSSVVMGVLLLGSIIILLYGRRKNGEMFVITDSDLTVLSLVFFSILSSIAITAGRFWSGFGTAIASRYMTITSLGVYGIYMLFLRTASLGANGSSNSNSDSNNFVRYFHALVAVVLIGLVATYLFGVKRGIELHEDRTNMKYALQSFCGQPDETLQAMYPTVNVFRERAAFLCSEGLSVFGEVPQVGNTTMTNCCLCPVDRAP